MPINLNWFLGVLAIELWIAPYIVAFWPEISAAWRAWRLERRLARLQPVTSYALARIAS